MGYGGYSDQYQSFFYNRRSTRVVTRPASTPVTLQEAKDYLRVTDSADDALIQDLIEIATDKVENYIRRALITQTRQLVMDSFDTYNNGDERFVRLGGGVFTGYLQAILGQGDRIELPFLPIQTVTFVDYFDRGNNRFTIDPNIYQLDGNGGRIYLNEGQIWVSADVRKTEGVLIEYVCGYGDAADVPTPIKQAIRQNVVAMYEYREGCGDGGSVPLKQTGLLDPYKIFDYLNV